MTRYGSVIGLNADKLDEYKRLHAAVWPDVLKMIKQCNIRNYSIYLRRLEGRYYLFSYFEYIGTDFAADMAKMAADPTTQRWWDICIPCQVPLADRQEGEWWAEHGRSVPRGLTRAGIARSRRISRIRPVLSRTDLEIRSTG